MSDEPDYILEISSLSEAECSSPDSDPVEESSELSAGSRNWIGVQFECCGIYARIYRNREGTAYVGHCPRCQRCIEAKIGPGGTAQRIFRAR